MRGLFGRNKTNNAKENYRRVATPQSFDQMCLKMVEMEGKNIDDIDDKPQYEEYDRPTGKIKPVKLAFSSETNQDNSSQLSSEENMCFEMKQSVLDFIPTPALNDLRANMTIRSNSASSLASQENAFLGFKPEEQEVPEGGNEDEESASNDSSPTPIDTSAFLDMDPEFESVFGPEEMRCLALVSHNNMKDSMRQFVLANKNVLKKKFRLTGTNTTMTMLKEIFGADPEVVYGSACKSGPLGGDAQLVAMAVSGEVGGCIFFIDPMDHPPLDR